MKIGEIAAHFGLPTHVLRHWEAVGLISPTRTRGTRRQYGHEDLYRVAMILRAKQAGFGLEDIREMINARDPEVRHGILQRHRCELVHRVTQAQISLALIDGALDCNHDDIATCPRFQAALSDIIGGGLDEAIPRA